MKSKRFLILCAILMAIPVMGFADAKWTVLVYLNGDNNLEEFGISDFGEMAQIGSNSDMNIVVQFDRANGYDTSNGNWKTCKRFYVTQGMTPTAGNALSDLGEVDMGNPNTLVTFVNWGIDNYPAEKYFVIVWNHGGGWTKGDTVQKTVFKDCSNDDSSGNEINVANGELRSAATSIKNHLGSKVDLWGFDCCLMQMFEVGYELKDAASYLVASEELEGGNGWTYDNFLTDIKNNPSISAADLGKEVVKAMISDSSGSKDHTLSCVNLGQYDNLKTKLNLLAQELIVAGAYNNASIKSAINNAKRMMQGYADSYTPAADYRDLGDFLNNIKNTSSLPAALKTAATNAITAMNSAVYYNDNSNVYSDCNGITIYLPDNHADYYTSYGNCQFAKNTDWELFLKNEAAMSDYTPTGDVYTKTVNANIPDDNTTGITSTISVNDSSIINEVNLYLDITHTYIGDLTITLAHASETVLIHNKSGGSADNIIAWYDEDVVPAETLDAFNGMSAYGTWSLTVKDTAGSDTGTLNSWKVEIQ